MNSRETKNAWWANRNNEPVPDPPSIHNVRSLYSRHRWRIENATLLLFAGWLLFAVVVLCAISEMRGW